MLHMMNVGKSERKECIRTNENCHNGSLRTISSYRNHPLTNDLFTPVAWDVAAQLTSYLHNGKAMRANPSAV